MYICTEGPVPIKRLQTMAATMKEQFGAKVKDIDFLSNFHCLIRYDAQTLVYSFNEELENLIKTKNIGLIVIDSIAAVFRVEDQYMERAKHMRIIFQKLLYLSCKYDFAVVCVNQVTSRPDKQDECIPALGLAWANLVTTRFQIYKDGSILTEKGEIKFYNQQRVMQIRWAPHLPSNQAKFFITPDGLLTA